MMDVSVLKEWLVPLSTSIGIAVAICGAWVTLRDFRLKLRAEARLAHSAEVEADVKLLKLFTELMNIAHARGGNALASDKLFEALLPKLRQQGITDVMQAAVISFPVGLAAQNAAIAAIAELGRRHTVLLPAALQALETLESFKATIVAPLLVDLRAHQQAQRRT